MRRISAALTSCIVFGGSNSFAAAPPKCELQKKLEQIDIASKSILTSFAAHDTRVSLLISTTSIGKTTVNVYANATGSFGTKAVDTIEAAFTFIDGPKTYVVKNVVGNPGNPVKTQLAELTQSPILYLDGPQAKFNAVTKVGNDYIFVGKPTATNLGSFYKGNDLTKLKSFSTSPILKGEILNVAGTTAGVAATSPDGLSVLTNNKVRDVKPVLATHKGEVAALATSQLVVDSNVNGIRRSTDWFTDPKKSNIVQASERYSRIVGSEKTVYALNGNGKTLVVSVDEGVSFTAVALPEAGTRVVKQIAYDTAKSTLYVVSATANKLDFHTIVCKPGAAHATAAFSAAVFLSILAALFV